MKIKTINLLSFKELNEDQKKKVIENYNLINVDDDEWHNFIIEEWKEKLARQGFEDANINFSGFWSQGDGASFNCSVNLEKFLKGRRAISKYSKEIKKQKEEGFNVAIKNGGFYYHEYTMAVECYDLENDQLENFILEEAREQARKIYKELEKNYEYLTGEESITETLIVNEYLFNEETLKIDF